MKSIIRVYVTCRFDREFELNQGQIITYFVVENFFSILDTDIFVFEIDGSKLLGAYVYCYVSRRLKINIVLSCLILSYVS